MSKYTVIARDKGGGKVGLSRAGPGSTEDASGHLMWEGGPGGGG